MFALPDSLPHVTSAAFAQADLLTIFTRHGVVKAHLTRNHQHLTRGSKMPLLWSGIPNMLLTDTETAIQEVVSPPMNFTYRLRIPKMAVSSHL